MPKFQKGKSGNRKGRPRGRPDKRTALRTALESKGGKLLEELITLAEAGNVDALKFLIGRLLPPATQMPVNVGGRPATGTLADLARSIVEESLAGRLAPDHALQLTNAVASAARVEELNQLRNRLEALEKHYEIQTQTNRNGSW